MATEVAPPRARTVTPDPQLNVILAALGVACIAGALIFSDAGKLSGLLFIVGIDIGISLGVLPRVGVPLVAGALVVTAALWGAGRTTSILDLGIVIGAVIGAAAVGRLRLSAWQHRLSGPLVRRLRQQHVRRAL
jgi:hypothetical protein